MSLFTLTLNMGMTAGYILSSYVPYHIIPIAVIVLPLLYLFIETFFPETPSYLLIHGKEEQAENSLKFYMNHTGNATKLEIEQFNVKFAELKSAVKQQKSQNDGVTLKDFCK